jgi:hypothetical protein
MTEVVLAQIVPNRMSCPFGAGQTGVEDADRALFLNVLSFYRTL